MVKTDVCILTVCCLMKCGKVDSVWTIDAGKIGCLMEQFFMYSHRTNSDENITNERLELWAVKIEACDLLSTIAESVRNGEDSSQRFERREDQLLFLNISQIYLCDDYHEFLQIIENESHEFRNGFLVISGWNLHNIKRKLFSSLDESPFRMKPQRNGKWQKQINTHTHTHHINEDLSRRRRLANHRIIIWGKHQMRVIGGFFFFGKK